MKVLFKKKFYRPITISQNGLLLSKKNKLFLMDINSYAINFFCKIKINGLRGFLGKTRFLTRLFHRYVYCGITNSRGDCSFIAFNDGVYKVDYEKRKVSLSLSFSCPGMHRPLSFFEIKNVDGFDDSIVFGDYCYNKDRREMSVYQFKNNKWEKVFTFQAGLVRHIHSIISDCFRNRVLILTGDLDEESAVWVAENNFQTVTCLYKGSQKYRFCAAKAYKDGVILITDSPFNQNKVYLLKETETESLIEIADIPGPTVFFTNYNDNIVFATDVENDEKNLSPFSEFFVNKKGDGVQDNYSHVFICNEEFCVKEICKFEKDFLPMRVFGFGTVHFPDGNPDGKLFCYPMAVKKYDQTLLCIKVGE